MVTELPQHLLSTTFCISCITPAWNSFGQSTHPWVSVPEVTPYSFHTPRPSRKTNKQIKTRGFRSFFLFLPSTLLSVSARLPHPAGVDDGFTTAHARAMAGVHAGWKGDSVDTSTRDISTICRRSSGWRGARDQTATAAAKSLFCTRRVRGL